MNIFEWLSPFVLGPCLPSQPVLLSLSALYFSLPQQSVYFSALGLCPHCKLASNIFLLSSSPLTAVPDLLKLSLHNSVQDWPGRPWWSARHLLSPSHGFTLNWHYLLICFVPASLWAAPKQIPCYWMYLPYYHSLVLKKWPINTFGV